MKFGVLQFFSWPERRGPLSQVYARALERIDIMDRTGFDAVWLAEHHFSTYSVCPSVHLMGMHVADRTQQLRIGMGVSLAAFYHPLRLAEEVAMLDQLSGGRVNWGAGRGFDRKEMENFGVPPDESYARFREAVEIVQAAWKPGKLTYRGQFHTFEDVEVLPKPLQEPMPVWLAASSEEALCWAADQGAAVLMDPHATHAELGDKRQFYERRLAAAGHAVDQPTPMARLLAIAGTDEEALEIARNGARWTIGTYANSKTAGQPMADQPSDEARIQRYVDEVIIHGCPERVADQLCALRDEIKLDYLLASILSHETFVRLADEVMPRVNA